MVASRGDGVVVEEPGWGVDDDETAIEVHLANDLGDIGHEKLTLPAANDKPGLSLTRVKTGHPAQCVAAGRSRERVRKPAIWARVTGFFGQ